MSSPSSNSSELAALQKRVAELEQQRESGAEFQVMVDHAPMAIITVDSRRLLRHVNRNAALLFGYDAQELLGQPLGVLIPENVRAEHETVTGEYMKHPEAREMGKGRYLNGRRKDGALIPVEIALSPIELGGERHVMALIADITQRRKWEKEREEMLRRITETQKLESIGVLAGGVAHDFNNILTGIMLNAALLRDELPVDSAHQQLIASIRESGAKAADLCRQLLSYAGKAHCVIEQCDLSVLVRSTIKLVHASIGKTVDLSCALASPGPLVRVDATQMSQVVMNLIINASEALSERGGQIQIMTGFLSVERDWFFQIPEGSGLSVGTYAMLSVEDNGMGISPENQQRIFEPFFTTKFQGRGLGLSAVLGIIRAHGGALRLDSEVGKGTRFTILLPLST